MRHHPLHILDDEIGDERLQRWKQVADLRGDDALDLRFGQHPLQRMREVLQHDDGRGAGIVQLMLELARRVERIDVDHGKTGTQRPK